MELLRSWGLEDEVRAGQLDIGADGAHSPVRACSASPWTAPTTLSEQLTVLFEAPPGKLVGDRPCGIYFIQHPEAASVADLPVRPVAKGAFSFAAQVAGRYREGRAFLVGDAAQRMTPRGGMGMNTAVAEGHDLGWKLGWVLHGWAGPDLLDTYDRRHHPPHPAFPLDLQAVDRQTAATLGVGPDGALLVRPDAQPVAHWPTAPPDPRAELTAALSGWVGQRLLVGVAVAGDLDS